MDKEIIVAKTIQLEYPISFGSIGPITKIGLRRIKGKDLKRIKDINSVSLKEILLLAADLSGQVPEVFDEMDAADILSVSEVVGGFLESGRKTGKKS